MYKNIYNNKSFINMTSNLISCDKCFTNLIILDADRDYNESIHYYICKKCINNYTFYSKTDCINKFLLSQDDLLNLKYLYLTNLNNIAHLYKEREIINHVILKYGNINNFNNLKQNKENKKIKLKIRKQSNIEKRKHQLVQTFKDNKIEIPQIFYGSCYEYIYNNVGDLNSIINDKMNEIVKINKRRFLLKKMLHELDIKYTEVDENLYNYIYYDNIDIKKYIKTINNNNLIIQLD
jgi:hypothetical protein